jgi:hypothetical protein
VTAPLGRVGSEMRANVYVDGFNLYYGAMKGKGPGYKWLDVSTLAARLQPKDTINRIRYFTARVGARSGDPQQPQRQQTYLRALRTIPVLSIHEGHYSTHAKWRPLAHPGPPPAQQYAEVLLTEEKGSDVNLATYLLIDAFNHDCQVAVVITNDSDLAEPIALAQSRLGIMVGVINPHPPKYRSLQLKGTFFKQLRDSAVKGCQFPEYLTDARGQFQKPPHW